MTDTHLEPEDDVLDLTPADVVEGGESELEDHGDAPAFVGFDDEPDTDAEETPLIKRLRESDRDKAKRLHEQTRRIRELEAQTTQRDKPAPVGEKPTLESCEWDGERFEQELNSWLDRKTAADAQSVKDAAAERAQQDQWARVTQDYQAKRAALGYPDVQEVEKTALDALSGQAQAIIARHADNAALLIYALGKSPAKLAELTRLDADGDGFALVKAMTRMEGSLTTRKPTQRPPDPDRAVRGNRSVATESSDKVLAKLEADAEKTGDRTKIVAHKRAMREKAK